jgi:hypothetical protein
MTTWSSNRTTGRPVEGPLVNGTPALDPRSGTEGEGRPRRRRGRGLVAGAVCGRPPSRRTIIRRWVIITASPTPPSVQVGYAPTEWELRVTTLHGLKHRHQSSVPHSAPAISSRQAPLANRLPINRHSPKTVFAMSESYRATRTPRRSCAPRERAWDEAVDRRRRRAPWGSRPVAEKAGCLRSCSLDVPSCA